MKTIYWSKHKCRDNQEFVSELKYYEPVTVYKDMNAKEFLDMEQAFVIS